MTDVILDVQNISKYFQMIYVHIHLMFKGTLNVKQTSNVKQRSELLAIGGIILLQECQREKDGFVVPHH